VPPVDSQEPTAADDDRGNVLCQRDAEVEQAGRRGHAERQEEDRQRPALPRPDLVRRVGPTEGQILNLSPDDLGKSAEDWPERLVRAQAEEGEVGWEHPCKAGVG